MLCLDTYALVEIISNNPNYAHLTYEDFIIPDTTLAEFHWVLIKDLGSQTADYWIGQFRKYLHKIDIEIYIKANKLRRERKKQKLSFFDCVGYTFALENNLKFVTGDKEFKNKKNVMFISK